MRWATRAGCHVDRAACAWLIRRFIDPEAEFVFVGDPDEVPADARAQEQLEWVADEVAEAGGEATLWQSRLTSAGAELALAQRMVAVIAAEYRRLIAAAEQSRAATPVKAQTVARLRRELRRISRRDYFPPPERDEARRAVESLMSEVAAR